MIYHEVIDLEINGKFWSDYETAPDSIKNKVDRIVQTVGKTGYVPRSLNAHLAATKNIWIGYVTRAGQHWRLLFYFDKGVMELVRLVPHEEMDEYLKVRR